MQTLKKKLSNSGRSQIGFSGCIRKEPLQVWVFVEASKITQLSRVTAMGSQVVLPNVELSSKKLQLRMGRSLISIFKKHGILKTVRFPEESVGRFQLILHPHPTEIRTQEDIQGFFTA